MNENYQPEIIDRSPFNMLTLIGMKTSEAIGHILREGMDFRIVSDNGKLFYRPDVDDKINLSLLNGKVISIE